MEKNLWDDPDNAQWGSISKNAELFIDRLTGREDIVVVTSPDLRSEDERRTAPIAAGCFYPDHARINIDATQVFDPAQDVYHHVDPSGVFTQKTYPAFVGTLVHEASHAKHSTWDMRELAKHDAGLGEWATTLEELRAERQMVEAFPQYSNHIKVIVKTIVSANSFTAEPPIAGGTGMSRHEAARTAMLVLGREDYGVFEPDELDRVREQLRNVLGADLDALVTTWQDVYDVADDDVEGMIEVARKVKEIVRSEDDPETETQDGSEDSDGAGKNGSGSGESGSAGSNTGSMAGRLPCGSYLPTGDPENSADPEQVDPISGQVEAQVASILDALSEAVEKEIAGQDSNQSYIFPKSEHEKNEERRKEIAKQADKVKSMASQGGRGYGYSYYYNTPKHETPSQTDISRSRAMTEAIRKAHYRDVSRTVVKSQLPPGRLVIREAMNRQAQISNGQNLDASPWRQTRRRTVDNPPITFGVVTDISGSMDRYQREVASFTWAITNAVQSLGGNVGALAWNTDNSLYEMVKPHTKISKTIDYYTAGGGSNGLPSALKGIDGMLNLSFGEGVRMVAIITDGQLPDAQRIQKEVTYLTDHGVIVVWINTTTSNLKIRGVTYAHLNKPEDFGRIVGPQLIEALANYVS